MQNKMTERWNPGENWLQQINYKHRMPEKCVGFKVINRSWCCLSKLYIEWGNQIIYISNVFLVGLYCVRFRLMSKTTHLSMTPPPTSPQIPWPPSLCEVSSNNSWIMNFEFQLPRQVESMRHGVHYKSLVWVYYRPTYKFYPSQIML